MRWRCRGAVSDSTMGGMCSKQQGDDGDPPTKVKHVNPLMAGDALENDSDDEEPLSPGRGQGTASTALEEDASEPPSNDGHDHDAEEEAARIEMEGKLLPPPEEVVLWTEHKYNKEDDKLMKEQGAKAVEWLVQALLAAWCSDNLKTQGRRLLAVRAFTANLRFMQLWHETTTASNTSVETKTQTVLMTPICSKLEQLGQVLEENYVADSLYNRLGSLVLPLHPLVEKKGKGNARQGLCVPAPPPGWYGRPKHRGEFVYLQVLLMVSSAVNDAFHQWCKDTLGDTISELQTPPIKSYGRMRNKMFSADDHRFRDYPRPEWNVDINRVLAIAFDPESMTRAAEALSRASGGVAKQKNGFALTEAQAAPQYHLRLVMISVLFGMPAPDGSGRVQTYAELVADPRVKKMWDDYALKPPQAGEPGCEWDADVAAARAWLESKKVGKQLVQMISEVQMVLPLTCAVRHKMHELYKVARADTDKQLYLDFKVIGDKEERIRQAQYDDATSLRRACRLGDLDEVQKAAEALAMAETGPTLDEHFDDAFIVACRHGQVDVIEMELMQPPRQRVAWAAADEMTFKCERPSMEVLQILLRTPGWTWDNKGADRSQGQEQQHIYSYQYGHTLLHTACREGHTNIVDLCLKKGTDVNARRSLDGLTGLYIAAQYGHVAIVDALLRANADHSLHHTATGASPLYTAAESGHYWVVERLIAAKADLAHESQDRPAHLIAANNAHKDVVVLLTSSQEKKLGVQRKRSMRKVTAALPGKGKGKDGAADTQPAPEANSAAARRAAMVRRKKQQKAGVASGHIMQGLARQLNETFTQAGMTPEQLFNTFEKDGDGKISQEEFERMLKSLGADIPAHTLEHLFTILDNDGGGEIDLQEFIAWTQNEGAGGYSNLTQSDLVDGSTSAPSESASLEATGRVISMAQTKEAT